MEDLLKKRLFIFYNIVRHDCIIELSGVSPSPSKDFHHCIVSSDKVIFRSWKITARQDATKFHPSEKSVDFFTFKEDDRLQNEMVRVFGQHTVDYIFGVMDGKLDILIRLPDQLLMRIFSFLGLEDISRLSKVCTKFRKICNDNSLWETLFIRHCPTPLTPEMRELGSLYGWKRLFFSSKLQLQRTLRRHRNRKSDIVRLEHGFHSLPREDTTDVTSLPDVDTASYDSERRTPDSNRRTPESPSQHEAFLKDD